MKANELMVGDFLKLGKRILRCKNILGHTNDVMFENGVITNVMNIDPIPLTPEILEKNGFVLEGYKYVQKYDHYVCVWVIFATSDERHSVIHHSVIHIDDDRERIPTTYHNTINYAHELQHVLKLCKIEKTIEL